MALMFQLSSDVRRKCFQPTREGFANWMLNVSTYADFNSAYLEDIGLPVEASRRSRGQILIRAIR